METSKQFIGAPPLAGSSFEPADSPKKKDKQETEQTLPKKHRNNEGAMNFTIEKFRRFKKFLKKYGGKRFADGPTKKFGIEGEMYRLGYEAGKGYGKMPDVFGSFANADEAWANYATTGGQIAGGVESLGGDFRAGFEAGYAAWTGGPSFADGPTKKFVGPSSVYEWELSDFGSIIIRDTRTGKEAFIQGPSDDAHALRREIESAEDDFSLQLILDAYSTIMESPPPGGFADRPTKKFAGEAPTGEGSPPRQADDPNRYVTIWRNVSGHWVIDRSYAFHYVDYLFKGQREIVDPTTGHTDKWFEKGVNPNQGGFADGPTKKFGLSGVVPHAKTEALFDSELRQWEADYSKGYDMGYADGLTDSKNDKDTNPTKYGKYNNTSATAQGYFEGYMDGWGEIDFPFGVGLHPHAPGFADGPTKHLTDGVKARSKFGNILEAEEQWLAHMRKEATPVNEAQVEDFREGYRNHKQFGLSGVVPSSAKNNVLAALEAIRNWHGSSIEEAVQVFDAAVSAWWNSSEKPDFGEYQEVQATKRLLVQKWEHPYVGGLYADRPTKKFAAPPGTVYTFVRFENATNPSFTTTSVSELIAHMTRLGHPLTKYKERNPNLVFDVAEELIGQPMFAGIAGPMWDGGGIRYESAGVNRALSMADDPAKKFMARGQSKDDGEASGWMAGKRALDAYIWTYEQLLDQELNSGGFKVPYPPSEWMEGFRSGFHEALERAGTTYEEYLQTAIGKGNMG